MRRQVDLLSDDIKFLDEYGLPWETVVDGSRWVLIHDFPTHEGYTEPKAIAGIRLEKGYPMTALDMVYFWPAILRKDGKPIRQTNATQKIDGKVFQRWSRHRSAKNPWKPGEDNLESHILLIRDWLTREFEE